MGPTRKIRKPERAHLDSSPNGSPRREMAQRPQRICPPHPTENIEQWKSRGEQTFQANSTSREISKYPSSPSETHQKKDEENEKALERARNSEAHQVTSKTLRDARRQAESEESQESGKQDWRRIQWTRDALEEEHDSVARGKFDGAQKAPGLRTIIADPIALGECKKFAGKQIHGALLARMKK